MPPNGFDMRIGIENWNTYSKLHLFSEYCSIFALSFVFEFLWVDGGGGGWWFPAITLSQPNYSYGCFVVGVVVVVGL